MFHHCFLLQTQNYQIVAGLVVAITILLLACFFIFSLVVYSNNRKKKYIDEKQLLQQQFTEQLLQSQLEMQEQTFNTISGEIHDNVGQVLSLAKVQLNILQENKTFNEQLISEAKDSVGKAMVDLRDIAKSLNSERIISSSIFEMTEHELGRINRSGIMLTELTMEGKECKIEQQKKLIMFRIIQESLQNILKHSAASFIKINFCYSETNLNIHISDNGKGFNKGLISKNDGLGLQNIFTRASLMGGEATIESVAGVGTTIIINTPYA